MNLQLQLLANNDEKTWTLKSTRGNYSIGTIPGCDIELTGISVDVNLKFSYDEYGQIWYVSDLGKRGNLQIDGQPLSDYEIQAQSKITVERGVTLNLIPEGRSASGNGRSSRGSTSTAIHETSTSQVNHRTFSQAQNNQRKASSQANASAGLRKLTWAEYVDECVIVQGANRFSLITGYRFTPWVRATGSVGFNSFDGYIIPDFQEVAGGEKSSEVVSYLIQSKLGEMTGSRSKDYNDTDCCIVALTDAHIVDSLTQNFLWSWFWVEFFPVKRGIKNKRRDYRDFCVISYNRVKTYLLVENYGTDLFVSWMTRHEPPSPRIVQFLLLAIFIMPPLREFSVAVNNHNNLMAIGSLFLAIPTLLWIIFYHAVPNIMLIFGIMPKKANANFLNFCFGIPTIILSLFFGAELMSRLSHYNSSLFDSMSWILGFVSFIALPSFLIFLGILIASIFNPPSIPPLDLVDAKKLDDVVSKQVESVLKPMLERANYTTEQIGQILTRTSLGRIQFRR
jgi:hypothetical protein